ncbi:MAG: FAD-dependent oxidoreductase [Chloroflexi bacterium]|nr:FAD-dependent oxidoreductase [Chloroflexota bacterium]
MTRSRRVACSERDPGEGRRRGDRRSWMGVAPSIGVIGAGILGLTAALRFVQAGARVTVIEREDQVGGLVTSFQIGGSHLERFYHHLFRSDRDIQRLIAEVGLADDLIWARPDTSSLYRGRIHSLDSALDVLRFAPLPPAERLRLGACLAYLKLEPNSRRFEGQTAAAWIKRWMGPEVYRVVWGPLLRAKFGDYAEQVAMPWFWSRVHLRSQSLGYVRGGFYRLYQRLGEVLEERGANVVLGTEVHAIRSVGERVSVETSSGDYAFDRLLATTPTRVFMRLAHGLPEQYCHRYDWGDTYGAHMVVLGLKRKLLDGVYWLNIHDADYPFMAVVEHTNYLSPAEYGGLHIVYLGNYLPMSHELFRRPDEEVLGRFVAALRGINPLFHEDWIVESHVFKAPFAQPIVTVEYPTHIPPHETPLPGVYLANMFQVYPEDRGQNYSVRMANRVAAQILAASSGEPSDWKFGGRAQ